MTPPALLASLQRLLEFLTRPHPSIRNFATRAKSKLLAGILLLMTLVFGGLDLSLSLTLPDYQVTWYGYPFLLIAFFLNRAGKYRAASGLTMAMFPLVVFSNVASGESANPIATLTLSVLGIMLGSILLTRRGLIALAGICLAGTLLMPLAIPEQLPGLASVFTPSAILIIGAVLALVFIRQRDQIEEARRVNLRESEERLQISLRAGRMGAWDWDIPSGKVHWSENVHAMFGLETGQFEGTYKAYLSLLSEEERARVETAIREILQNPDQSYHIIHKLVTPRGEIRWIEGRAEVARDAAGQPLRMTGVVADITSRVEAETERANLLGKMEKRNAHLNAAARVSKSCNSILDPDLLIQQATDLIAEGFDLYYVGLFLAKDHKAQLKAGYGEAGKRMVRENFYLPVDEHSMVGWSIINQQARIAQKALNDNVRRVNPYLPETRSEMALPLISRGRVIGAITIQSKTEDAFDSADIAILQTLSDQIATSIENARLVSELQSELIHRLMIEQELEQERDFAVLVMSTLGQGVIVTDEQDRLEYANPAFARMIGAPQEQILGKKTSEFVHPEDRPKLERLPGLERKTDSFEVRFLRSNGQVAHVLITSSPRHAENRALGSIAAMIDLTERKQAEMEREALIRELETKNAELERFTYTVSHDLKSPLITIRGFLGYLLADAEKGDLERLESDAKRITDATNRMQRLLDDLLELSRVGRLTHPPEDVSFGQIVQEALTIVEGRLAARRVQVQVEPRLPTVHVDRVRMVEVIQNLLDNAVKFMGEQAAPTIQIGMKIVGGEQAFFVADNGIGIESKYHEKIFGLFERLNPNVDGTGVGLALVKRIIELHGGKIWLESALGKGTTFYFTLASAT